MAQKNLEHYEESSDKISTYLERRRIFFFSKCGTIVIPKAFSLGEN